ncbi:MAG: hypothetical protein LIO93_06535 [Bacteroidales bacterium]|nr:hypothetical protein [Bacteroidales bacterium]
MNKKLLMGLLFVLPLIFFSCEYELNDTNFLEVKKPPGDPYIVELIENKNEKGEYVINYPFIRYSTDFPTEVGEQYRRIAVYEEGYNYPFDIIRSYDDNYIQFYSYPNGTYILRYTVQVPSETGSLADKTGYEYLGNTYEWKIKWDPTNSPKLNLKYEFIDEFGRIRLTWDKPEPNYPQPLHYIVYLNNWDKEHEIITNENSCEIELVDNGYNNIYVRAVFESNYIPYLSEDISIYNY